MGPFLLHLWTISIPHPFHIHSFQCRCGEAVFTSGETPYAKRGFRRAQGCGSQRGSRRPCGRSKSFKIEVPSSRFQPAQMGNGIEPWPTSAKLRVRGTKHSSNGLFQMVTYGSYVTYECDIYTPGSKLEIPWDTLRYREIPWDTLSTE